MRKKKTDVIVWEIPGKLMLDLPKGTLCYTLSDGTLRAIVAAPAGMAPLDGLVDCIGRPITSLLVAA